ncbi:hypothetical protein KKF91_18750, partial [Myxococcota bacterium]|nr:hypothetical protein [Myxococcota bacterium]
MNLESFKGAMSGFYTAHGDKARFLISAVISFTAPGVVKDAWDLIDKGIDLASKKEDTTAALQTALSALTPQEQNQLGMVLEELAKSEMLPVFRRLKTLTRQKAEPTQEMIQAVLNQQLKDRAVLQRLSRESVRQRIGLSQMQRSLAEVLRAQNALEETQKAQQQLLEAIFHGYPADALETSKRADEQAVYFSWLETRMGALEALLVENEETKGERLGALKATAQRWVKTKESPDGVSTAQFADILAVAEAVVKVPEESKVLVQGLASRMPEKLRKDTGLEAYLPPPAPSKPASVRPKPGAMQPNWKTLVPEMVMIPPSPSDGLVFKMGADN